MASYKDYGEMLKAYYAAHPYLDANGKPLDMNADVWGGNPQAEISGWGMNPADVAAADAAAKYRTDTGNAWLASLTPQQRAEYEQLHQQSVDAKAKKARMGAFIALGAPLLAAGAGALGAFGAGGGTGAGALGGATSFPVYSPALPVLTDIPGGLTAGLGAAGAGTGALGNVGGVVKSIAGGGAGGSGGINWGALLGGAGLGAGALAAIQALQNRNDMPQLPDFIKLAEQTAASRNAAVDAQTLANRPNQINAMGDTSTWTIGPDGRPVQKTQFGAANQQRFDQNSDIMSKLQGQIANQAGQPLQAPTMGSAMANALRTRRVI